MRQSEVFGGPIRTQNHALDNIWMEDQSNWDVLSIFLAISLVRTTRLEKVGILHNKMLLVIFKHDKQEIDRCC